MEKYTLFLDESTDKEKGLILVAGFAIPNKQLELFSSSILEIKKLIWDENFIKNNATILRDKTWKCINVDIIKFIAYNRCVKISRRRGLQQYVVS